MSATVILALVSRSQQISAAAIVLAAGWLTSVCGYFVLPLVLMTTLQAAIDAALAGFFWRQSKGRWFPVPLFVLHALLMAHNTALAALGENAWSSMMIVVNRLFELALAYVCVCALYRTRRMRLNEKGAPGGRAFQI